MDVNIPKNLIFLKFINILEPCKRLRVFIKRFLIFVLYFTVNTFQEFFKFFYKKLFSLHFHIKYSKNPVSLLKFKIKHTKMEEIKTDKIKISDDK
jgi:hypothetical protein